MCNYFKGTPITPGEEGESRGEPHSATKVAGPKVEPF